MADDTQRFTIRPFSKTPRTDLKDAFRLYMSPSTLSLLRMRGGDVCTIWKDLSQKGNAVAWPAPEKIQDHIVQTSKMLQATYGLVLGDKVKIQKVDRPISTIRIACLEDVTSQGVDQSVKSPDLEHWEWFLEDPLERAETLALGMVIDHLTWKGQSRSYRINRIVDSSGAEENLARFTSESCVKIINQPIKVTSVPLELSTLGLEGVESKVNDINRIFGNLKNYTTRSWLSKPGGLLLYGPGGTGKTHLLQKIAAIGWGAVFRIDTSSPGLGIGENATELRKVFKNAKSQQRSIIIIDQLELIVSKTPRENSRRSLARSLKAEMEALADLPEVFVIAATNQVNEIDPILRTPDCFEFEIEIPIPNRSARTKIIRSLLGMPSTVADVMMDNLGERTHGFNVSDLRALIRMSGWLSIYREQAWGFKQHHDHVNNSHVVNDGLDPPAHGLTLADIEGALSRVRPTAMREIILEVPKIRWKDIGGQETVKQALRETFEWPLKNPSRMERLGIQPRKGLLLYGPPGCSKTLTAKALATESGLNFIAVKGAEILNMYVGESERTVRDIFVKARAVSPSIIFFDEIDAIASVRDSQQAGSLNVLTTLLNEMDGIESLRDVTVLAATNKPEVLDLALMRPGRLDTILYVGPPDLEARREILRIQTAKMDIAKDVQLDHLAAAMEGYTGAEVVSICNMAGYHAFADSEATGREEVISRIHFQEAMNKVNRQVSPELRMRYENWSVGGQISRQ